jgi:hypothetical protein
MKLWLKNSSMDGYDHNKSMDARTSQSSVGQRLRALIELSVLPGLCPRALVLSAFSFSASSY